MFEIPAVPMSWGGPSTAATADKQDIVVSDSGGEGEEEEEMEVDDVDDTAAGSEIDGKVLGDSALID